MASLKANTVSGIGTGGPTFDGGLKFRSLNYLTIPKGTTVERTTLGTATDAAAHSATRAIFAGSYSYGNSGARPVSNVIDYVQVATTGDATDFGDLTESKGTSDGLSAVDPFGGTKNDVAENVDTPTISGDPSSFSFDKFLILICDITLNLHDYWRSFDYNPMLRMHYQIQHHFQMCLC